MCANSSSITFFAWNFKIFFAILTDIYRPFGLRRKPWMLFGWTMVLVILMVRILLTFSFTYLLTHSFTNYLLTYSLTNFQVLMFGAHTMNASTWLSMLLLMQGFLMFSDVPADGYRYSHIHLLTHSLAHEFTHLLPYSVELGKLESDEQRGQILATGQRIRFTFSVLAGVIQTFLGTRSLTHLLTLSLSHSLFLS